MRMESCPKGDATLLETAAVMGLLSLAMQSVSASTAARGLVRGIAHLLYQ